MSRHYKLLGGLTVEEDGRPSPLTKCDRGSALMAVLIVHGLFRGGSMAEALEMAQQARALFKQINLPAFVTWMERDRAIANN